MIRAIGVDSGATTGPDGQRSITWAESCRQAATRLAEVGDWACNCRGRTFRQDDEMFRKLRDMTICGICEKCNESLEH